MNVRIVSGYHDAELKGVDSSDARSVVLSFCLQDGQKKSLKLNNCEFFRVNDFVSQNVVSRLLIYQGQDIDKLSVIEKLEWATSLCDTSSFLGEERLDDIVAKMQRGECSLLVLEPSWGAELVVLFGDIVDPP